MKRRSGITLVEVLVAIFIMGIGLIALLTLFPLGFLRMAQAIRDNRASCCALSAQSLGITHDIRNDPLVISAAGLPDLFKDPLGNAALLLPADDYGASHPVFVDPIGYYGSVPGVAQDWVGGYQGVLRRRPVNFTGANQTNIKMAFTLWDDINFESVNAPTFAAPGTPQVTGASTLVSRDTRFSWGYVFQRPQTADRSIVDCSIVVFDQRPTTLTNNATLEENVYPSAAYFNTANSTITIDYTNNVPPPVRPGNWIMDATYVPSTFGPYATTHAFFYRVVASEEFVDATVAPNRTYVRYEVQQAIRGAFPGAVVSSNSGVTLGYQGTAVVISGIVEVLEKGSVRLP